MSWISLDGTELKQENLETLYAQIKEERRFWFDKCLSYMNFYYTINITLFSGFFLAKYFEKVQSILVVMPVLSLFICFYAKKINRICHKQFLENTVIMVKLEYLLGMYTKLKVSDLEMLEPLCKIPFKYDNFLGIERHYKNMIKFSNSDRYVEKELEEKNRSYTYNNKALDYMIYMSIALIVYGVLGNIKFQQIFTYF